MKNLLVPNYWNQTNHFFEDFFNEILSVQNKSQLTEKAKKSSYPKMDIYDNSNTIVVDAAVPGLEKNDIDISWSDDILTVKADKQTSSVQNTERFHLKELHRSSFVRQLNVSEEHYKINEISAKVNNGILKIEIPKKRPQKEEKLAKKIEVK